MLDGDMDVGDEWWMRWGVSAGGTLVEGAPTTGLAKRRTALRRVVVVVQWQARRRWTLDGGPRARACG